jgi:hypothetical protein
MIIWRFCLLARSIARGYAAVLVMASLLAAQPGAVKDIMRKKTAVRHNQNAFMVLVLRSRGKNGKDQYKHIMLLACPCFCSQLVGNKRQFYPYKMQPERGLVNRPKWHHIFPLFFLKRNHMPNSQNRGKSSNNSGQGHPDDPAQKASAPKPNPERSDKKHGGHDRDHRGDTSRSSNQGRKEASGGGND